MRLVSRALGRIRNYLNLPPKLVTVDLQGRLLRVRDGTMRAQPDYDDAWFEALVKEAEIIFDIGANVGYNALLAGQVARARLYLLVDANTEALCVAAENLIRNGLSHGAHFVNAFVGEVGNQRVQFWTVGTGAAGSFYRSHARSAAKRSAMSLVSSITLDELSERYEAVPDFVKIDVEGAEGMVLAGSSRTAAAGRTRFLVEMHSNLELSMAQNAGKVLDWCERHSYGAWYLKEACRLFVPETIAKRGRCHLLLQPNEWPYPEFLVGIEQSAPLDTAPAHACASGGNG